MTEKTPFDPTKHLVRMGRAEYLEVKWRLVWLRDNHPDADIETEVVSISSDHAVFKARVSIPFGGSATGYGSESSGDFRDFIEKAETKALGRALAALGFGTQFAPDISEGADEGAVADAPVTRPQSRPIQRGQQGQEVSSAGTAEYFKKAFEEQLGITREDTALWLAAEYGQMTTEKANLLRKRLREDKEGVLADVSSFINKSHQQEGGGGPTELELGLKADPDYRHLTHE